MPSQTEWDKRHFRLLKEIASWSKDPSTKVAAIIVDQYRRPVSWGYNGFPMGVEDNPGLLIRREEKYKYIVHAEKNALLFAMKALDRCTLYSTLPPCAQCSAALIQMRISRIVSLSTQDYMSRWASEVEAARFMCTQAGVPYEVMTYDI